MKNLLYILCFAEKRSCVSRKNCWDILCFAEKSKTKLIFRKQKCPLPLVANAVAISLKRILRLRVEVLAIDFWNSSYFYWSICFIFTGIVSFYFYWNSLFFLSNFLGEWGGLPVRAKPHEPVYFICIWKDEITTSLERNNYHLIFC